MTSEQIKTNIAKVTELQKELTALIRVLNEEAALPFALCTAYDLVNVLQACRNLNEVSIPYVAEAERELAQELNFLNKCLNS